MVLVHADAVKAELVGIFQLIQIVVVCLIADHRVVQGRVDIHPDRAILLAEVVRQIRIWHEVEPMELHSCLSVS